MGIKDWFESLRNKNKGFVYKLNDETKEDAPDLDGQPTADDYYDPREYEDTEYYDEVDDAGFNKAEFLQRRVPVDHVIQMCISTLYDEDGSPTQFQEDEEYAFFLTNYKVSTIIDEYKAGRTIDDIKCVQLTGDDMGELFEYCIYDDDESCEPAFLIEEVSDDWYDEYKNAELDTTYKAVHQKIRESIPAELFDDEGRVKIVGLVQLANGINIEANDIQNSRLESMTAEKREVDEFFS